MKIVADENMPLVKEIFAPFGEVVTYPGRELTAAHVWDADVLLVRSVTLVNTALLEGSRVKFVGSATIGVDHVDRHYLSQRNIHFASAPGCNANAVVQYVLSALFRLRPQWLEQTVGIVGCGNVGGRLYRTLKALGVNCRCYDPFLNPDTCPDLVSFEEIVKSDVLCLHTPLTTEGPYPTHHLFDELVLRALPNDALLLNAGRGAVVDNQALLKLLPEKSWQLVLDVWETEPDISLPLLAQVDIGTPHIAGYSYDGKINGTRMVRDAFCQWAGLEVPASAVGQVSETTLQVNTLAQAVLATFDVADSDRRMREALAAKGADIPHEFDQLRKTCPRRLEFQHYRLLGVIEDISDARDAIDGVEKSLAESLRQQTAVLGFK